MRDDIMHKSDMRKVFVTFDTRIRRLLTLDFCQILLLSLFVILLMIELVMLLKFIYDPVTI